MFMRVFLIAALFAGQAAADWAVDWAVDWAATPLDPADWPPEIVRESGAPASSVTEAGLPDGRVAIGDLDISAAWYEGPTRRYAHAILGDAIEAGALSVRTARGDVLTLDLPVSHVFEDRTPRIADLDGDGRAEVVAIRSARRAGGGVAVYGLRDGRLEEVAAIPDIGLSNRWLNIAAIADLTGDGRREIAFVKTPHIGGTLRVFAWKDGGLGLLDEMWGFSNHAIGAREMRLSALMETEAGPILAVPSADRRALRMVRMEAGALRLIAEVALPVRVDKAMTVEAGGFVVGLSDGSVMRVAP
ncbi:MAG: VCBS repeat-containing protein [Pseudomonadota bacterium]